MQREFEDLYNSIYEANITGCQCPCSYLEYRFNDDPSTLVVSRQRYNQRMKISFFQKSYGEFGFVLWNMSPNMLVDKRVTPLQL